VPPSRCPQTSEMVCAMCARASSMYRPHNTQHHPGNRWGLPIRCARMRACLLHMARTLLIECMRCRRTRTPEGHACRRPSSSGGRNHRRVRVSSPTLNPASSASLGCWRTTAGKGACRPPSAPWLFPQMNRAFTRRRVGSDRAHGKEWSRAATGRPTGPGKLPTESPHRSSVSSTAAPPLPLPAGRRSYTRVSMLSQSPTGSSSGGTSLVC